MVELLSFVCNVELPKLKHLSVSEGHLIITASSNGTSLSTLCSVLSN